AETATPMVPQLHPGVEDSQIEDAVNSLREVLRNWRQRNRPQQLGGYASGGYMPMGGAPGYPSIGAPGYPPTGGFPPTGYPTPAPQGYGPVISAAMPQTPPAGYAPTPLPPLPPVPQVPQVPQVASAYDPSPPVYTPVPQVDDSPTKPMSLNTLDTPGADA
ncbi:MAG: hypothetical protein ACRDID_22040, partial [Ktedonobacterales bacterium]